MVMGDFNAKVGSELHDNIVGSHWLARKTEWGGGRLIEWAQMNKMVVDNTWFKQHLRGLWTWQSPCERVRNQIDYIKIKKIY